MRTRVTQVCMTVAVALSASLAACADEEVWIVRPPGGGGGGSSGGGGGDAGVDGATELTGRLCVVDDLRAPDACPSTPDAAGVPIRVRGGATVTTGAGGAFTLPPITAVQIAELADGSAVLVPATARLVPGVAPALRVARAALFDDVLAAVGVPSLGAQGGVVVYVDDADGAVAGAIVTADAAAWPSFYDDGAATAWRTDAGTGAAGVALLLGVPASDAAAITVTPSGGAAQALTVPVRAGALTFVRAIVP